MSLFFFLLLGNLRTQLVTFGWKGLDSLNEKSHQKGIAEFIATGVLNLVGALGGAVIVALV